MHTRFIRSLALRIGAPLAALALAQPALAETAFVKCRWGDGSYPAFLISGNEGGLYGIYKIDPAGMFSWNSMEWNWAAFRCRNTMFGDGNCETAVTDSRYMYSDEFDANKGPKNNYGWTVILTVDRMNGAVSLYQRDYRYFGLSDDGDKESTLNGTCEKTADPALSPKPGPKL